MASGRPRRHPGRIRSKPHRTASAAAEGAVGEFVLTRRDGVRRRRRRIRAEDRGCGETQCDQIRPRPGSPPPTCGQHSVREHVVPAMTVER